MSGRDRLELWDFLLRRSVQVRPEHQSTYEELAWAALRAEDDAAQTVLLRERERLERRAGRDLLAELPRAA
ncbi:MAG: hypothetical protein ACM3UV_07900 [Nocardioidaceae bacterium]